MVPDAPTTTSPARAVPRSVRDAVLYMRQALERRMSMNELASATGVAERTLRRHFLAFLGESPLAHFRSMRLAAVRTALLAPSGRNSSVTQIATRFGFSHFGRFASDYERRFGELPSATLARGVSAVAHELNRYRARPRYADPEWGGALSCPTAHRLAPTLVIMPIRTAATAKLDERLLAGSLTDLLAATLARAHGFSVRRARSSLDAGAPAPSARYCLIGQLTRLSRGRLRVVLRLLDLAAGGRHLWGDAFEDQPEDQRQLCARVVQTAVAAVRPGIEMAEIDTARRKPNHELAAHDLVLRAMPDILAADAASARRALALLEQAVELDPADGAAAALAAWCRMQLVLYHATADPAAARSIAMNLADHAAGLDSLGDPLMLTARSCVAMWAGDPEFADALLARALAIDPSFGWAWERRATILVCYGNPERAIPAYRRAIALKGPRASPANCWSGIGYAHLGAGRYEDAARWLNKALAENPRASWLHFELVPCFIELNELQAARASVDRLRRAHPEMTVERAAATLPSPMQRIWKPRLERFVALGLPA